MELHITHCGVCHSDVHLVDDDWGMGGYPIVPGHEIIGLVTKKGPEVDHFQIGQRVGVGWQRSACLNCEFCLSGREMFCKKDQATCVGNFGGFADAIRLDSRFGFAIPPGLASENAAPLLCGGITVYSPLRHYQVTAPMKVGVVGIGGLGHLALQFARAMGCEVTAFSNSFTKEIEARDFGASHFLSSTDPKALEKVEGTLDFILVTAMADLDWEAYVRALRPDGKLCFVGVPPSSVSVPAFALIGGRKSICGSPTGSRAMITEMLEFSALHKIVAKTESMPLSQVNNALQRIRENQARYRVVLSMS